MLAAASNDITPLQATLGVVGPIVGGIIVLSIWFNITSWLSRRRAPKRIAFKGILDETVWSNVHVIGGTTFENVRVIGFTEPSNPKDGLPYELRGMVILEHTDGRRTLIQAKTIRMIEVPAAAKKP